MLSELHPEAIIGGDTLAPSASERHTFIGGSEAFELLNERQYGKGCVRALAYRKLQYPEDFPPEQRRSYSLRGVLKRGQLMEDIAARLYMDATGRHLIRRQRLARNHDFPGAGVHTDRIILAVDERGTGDAEIKSHGEGPFLNMLRNGLPPGHNLQLQWSLFCTGHTWGSFIILGLLASGDEETGLPLKFFDRDRDEETIDIFKREVDKFWNLLGKNELPPPPFPADDPRCKVCAYRLACRGEAIDPEEYARLMAERSNKTPLIPVHNDDLDQALADRALILGEIAALASEDKDEPGALQLVTGRIKELIGEIKPGASKVSLLVNKRWRVYCYDGSWSGLDTARLRQEQPDIYEKFKIVQRPTGTKRLRVDEVREQEQR